MCGRLQLAPNRVSVETGPVAARLSPARTGTQRAARGKRTPAPRGALGAASPTPPPTTADHNIFNMLRDQTQLNLRSASPSLLDQIPLPKFVSAPAEDVQADDTTT